MKTPCAEPEQLWNAYNDALNAFSRCVNDLASPELRTSDFAPKAAECQRANERCMAARQAWEQHVQQHRCDD